MASINKVILVGNIGKDPEIKNTNSGTVARFSVATTERWKDQNGNKQERTEWHNVTFFGKLADVVAQYLHKGSPVYVEGSLRTNKWTDNNGVERYSTGINGSVLQMLGSKDGGQNSGYQNNGYQNSQPVQKNSPPPMQSEDVPF